MVKNPGFFKIYVPSLGEENTKIPRSFSQSIQETWPTNLVLRDCYNNLWQVKVELIGGDWYFKDGWTEFAADNEVKGGDLLVYEYTSRGLLDFKVFDRSACSTKGVGGHRTKNYYERESLNNGGDDDVEEVNLERTHENGQRYDSTGEVQLRDDGGASTSKPRSSRDFDWYGVELFRSGAVRQPRNFYFVTKKRKHRTYELYIPMDVIRTYQLELPATISLFDPEGREFRATRKIWSDGRTFYTGGWRTLCEMNWVGDEDTCICEFVQVMQILSIHVSFFRP